MLELSALCRRYGDVVALDGLSFSVEAGQVHGFVGANGAGKTTAMRIVMGVERADGGTVRWRGAPIDAPARRRFGYMPEERGLYPKMPCGRQLAYLARLHGTPKARAREQAAAWLERFGLAERAGDKVEDLSLGNQQRVQLAAALVHEPDLLVLDEPFSGLDPIGTDVMVEVLLEQAGRGVPVIFSSHQLDLVERVCDAVAIIDAGRLVAHGPVEALRRGDGPELVRVDVDGATGAWWEALPGVALHRAEDGRVLLELGGQGDLDAVLDAARAAGSVRHFGAVEPTLAERYREVVGDPRASVGTGD